MTVTIATVMLCVLPCFAFLLFLLLLHHFLNLSHCLCDIFVGIFYRVIINDKLDPVITVSILAACLFFLDRRPYIEPESLSSPLRSEPSAMASPSSSSSPSVSGKAVLLVGCALFRGAFF